MVGIPTNAWLFLPAAQTFFNNSKNNKAIAMKLFDN